MSGRPRLGFDVVADKILNIHRDVCHAHKSSLHAVASVSRQLKSSFGETGAKRAAAGKRASAAAVVGDTSARKRRSVSVTPSESSTHHSLSSVSTTPTSNIDSVFGPSQTSAMLINQRHSLVQHHAYHRSSVMQHVYKRLSPHDIVRILPGDEVIAVLPATTPRLSTRALPVIAHYRRAFSRVLDRTLMAVNPSERTMLVDQAIEERHTYLRDNTLFWEFECRAKSYPLREQLALETTDDSSLNLNWDQGAGIELAVCGYTTSYSVLLKLSDVAFLHVYRKCSPEYFLNDGISFNNKLTVVSKLDSPFIEHLSLFDGCRWSTLEILWKYYRALYSCNQKRNKTAKASRCKESNNAATLADSKDVAQLEADSRDEIISFVRDELSSDSVRQFVSVVDSAYKTCFVDHYSGFHFVGGYLVDRRCIRQMYSAMKSLFPFVHSVISLTVCNPRGEMIDIFTGDDARAEYTDARAENTDSEGGSDADDAFDADLELSKRERAVLEFFIAKIRMRSQKTMGHWAMVPTLAAHSRGHAKALHAGPLSVGCDAISMWTRLNELFDDNAQAREDILRNQSSVSVVFDNWQVMIQKKWQTAGSSSNYLKGVAALAKKDKAILLPLGSLVRSPSGHLFRVIKAYFVNEYMTMIRAERVTGVDGDDVGRNSDDRGIDDNDVTRLSDDCDVGRRGIVDDAVGLPDAVAVGLQDDNGRGAIDDVGVLHDDHGMTPSLNGMPSVEVLPEPVAFTWPQIGWTVVLLKGLSPPAEISYRDPIVPPPMNACCESSVTSDELLFSRRDLRLSGDVDSRCISSDEYNMLIIDAEDVIILDTFRQSSKILHDWKEQMELEQVEDDEDMPHPYAPMGLPHVYDNEVIFLSLMKACDVDIFHARTFRSDMVKHLYPHSKVPDKYIHFPLIPRDETTNEGMTLTNAAILNSVGLIQKEEKGKYSLNKDAKERVVFMYGDALTVSLHGSIYDRTLRQITQLGNREYVEILLAAHDRIVIQKGQFHQLMHLLGTIYSQFYGGFMQPLQVSNGVKRVNGDPVKGGYQAHHIFAMQVYRAVNRLMLRQICATGAFNDISHIPHQSDASRLRSIINIYRDIRSSWEVSPHEPSRVAALFAKSMRTYIRCKRAISAHDSWHCEIESCSLMPIWKMFGKNTYLKLQCEYIEKVYDIKHVPTLTRELMRANAFCVLQSGLSVAFDEQVENYNRILKRVPPTPSLDIAVMRSRHAIIGEQANCEMCGLAPTRKKIRGTSTEDEIVQLEKLMMTAAIFCGHERELMQRDFFWNHVKPKIGVGSPRDVCKTTVAFDEYEAELNSRLFCNERGNQSNEQNEKGDDDDELRDDLSARSNDESICGISTSEAVRLEGSDDDDDDDNDDEVMMTQAERETRLEVAMKRLGNMSRKPLHKYATTDLFIRGKLMMGGIAKSRKVSHEKRERKRALIYRSLEVFGGVMDKRRLCLEACMTRSADKMYRYPMPGWKRKCKDHIKHKF